jgi:hypothetical protein
MVGVMMYVPIVALFLLHVSDRRRRATTADVEAHRRDHPGLVTLEPK